MAKKNLTVSIDETLLKELKDLSDSQRRTISNMVEWIIANQLGHVKIESKQ